jgi:lysophospholipase L1-like esterase
MLRTVWRFTRTPLAAGGYLAGQVLQAAHRPDLPVLENQDPSGTFGPAQAPPFRIVFLGDSSITAPGVDPLDDSWVRRVSHHLTDRYRVTAVSLAAGGAKIATVLHDQLDPALAIGGDLACLSVGGNDALRTTRVAAFEGDYRKVLDHLHAAFPAVVCGGIGDLSVIPRLPPMARGIAKVRGRSFDRAVARVVAGYPRAFKTTTWGPMWEPFVTDPETFADDHFHASGKGHAMFAAAAIPVIEEALSVSRAGSVRRDSGESSR